VSNKPSVSAHVTCRFSVPPERVFDAWLKPEQVRRWIFAPKPGERVMRVEIDPRSEVRSPMCCGAMARASGGDGRVGSNSRGRRCNRSI
jgi:uncharacterized protein YndB with AHSA1/START domain